MISVPCARDPGARGAGIALRRAHVRRPSVGADSDTKPAADEDGVPAAWLHWQVRGELAARRHGTTPRRSRERASAADAYRHPSASAVVGVACGRRVCRYRRTHRVRLVEPKKPHTNLIHIDA